MAVDVIAIITKLYTLLNHQKIRLWYDETYKLVYPKKQAQFLVQQHDIRWACKFEAIDLVAEHLNTILSTLSHVSNTSGSKHAEEAAGFYHKLISGKFIVALVTARAYLAENFLSKKLQAVDINWTDVEHCIRSTKAGIEEITTEKLLAEAEGCADKMNVPLSMTVGIAIHNTRRHGTSQIDPMQQVLDLISPFKDYMRS